METVDLISLKCCASAEVFVSVQLRQTWRVRGVSRSGRPEMAKVERKPDVWL